MTSEPSHSDKGLIEALHVQGPAAQHAGKLMLFGRFVGSWRLAWTGTDASGQPSTPGVPPGSSRSTAASALHRPVR